MKSKKLTKLAKAVLSLWDDLKMIKIDGLYGPVGLFDDKPTCIKMSEEILNPPKKSEKLEPATNPDDSIEDLFE